MEIAEYLLLGFAELPKKSAIIDGGNPIDVLFNISNHRDSKVTGGYEPDVDATIMFATSDVPSIKSKKGKIVSIDSEIYRIIKVTYGDVITSVYLQDTNKA